MKKRILLSVLIAIQFALVLPAFAQLKDYGGGYTLQGIITGARNATWIIFSIIVIICFVVAAVSFLTAQGDPSKIQTARASFLWGVAGVVVGIVAFSIVTIISKLL